MITDDVVKLWPVVAGAIASVTTGLGVWWVSQKDKRADKVSLLAAQTSNQKMAGDLLTGLSNQLMAERSNRESAITGLQDEARHLRDEIRSMRDENRVMREEAQKREDRLTAAEKDLVQFWIYAGDLETMLRERGIEPPSRPHGLYVIRGAGG